MSKENNRRTLVRKGSTLSYAGRSSIVMKRGPSLADNSPVINKYVKYFIFFMNVLFWVGGIAMVLLGAYGLFYNRAIFSTVYTLSQVPATGFMIVGSVTFLIGFIGCIGSLRENLACLKLFAVIIGLLIVMEIVVVVLAFSDTDNIRFMIKRRFFYMIEHYYDLESERHNMDSFQVHMKCCGVEDYADWQANVFFNCSAPTIGACGVPFTCCKSMFRLNSQCGYGIMGRGQSEIALRIHTSGCLGPTVTWIQNIMGIIGKLGASMLILQILSLCCARKLSMDIKKVRTRERF